MQVAGWGNLGASVTFLLMGSAFFPGFKSIFNGDSEMAWRTVNVVPAVVAVMTGAMIYFYTDDCPKGNYSELKRHGAMTTVSGWKSFCEGFKDLNTWILFIQYACCFGVELTMNNATALYFQSEFGQSTETAAAIASIFGWMNLFARGLGGFISDWASASWGMRGRIWVQTFLLIAEGVMVLVFVNSNTLSGAILYLNIFSLFVQAVEGSSFGIVPYVKPKYNGSVCGIVGAGGNVGKLVYCVRTAMTGRLNTLFPSFT
jgi:MFS transporter, NNP family, nitrate/nitrite transporter